MAEDPRQIRTRAALTAALLRLLEGESFAAIGVARLCLEAGVHRTTFYKHAASIEEFAVDVVTRELDTVSTITESETDSFAVYGRTMVDVLVHVAGERSLYRPLLESQWGGALRGAIDQRMQERVRIALDVFERAGADVPDNRDEVAAFVSGGLVGIIVLWALSDETDAIGWGARTQALMPEWWPAR